MITFLLRHYKAVIGISVALLGPMILASWGFILTTSQTNAKMPLHESRLQNLERAHYESYAMLSDIKSSLTRIEDRTYQELKEARQARQAVNNGVSSGR